MQGSQPSESIFLDQQTEPGDLDLDLDIIDTAKHLSKSDSTEQEEYVIASLSSCSAEMLFFYARGIRCDECHFG